MIKTVVRHLDWDPGNRDKCANHGISVEMITGFFQGEFRIIADSKHSQLETRYIAVGMSPDSRPMLVGFTFRIKKGRLLIRPISARYMHQKEARRYAQTFS
jgi:uncharacterized protein